MVRACSSAVRHGLWRVGGTRQLFDRAGHGAGGDRAEFSLLSAARDDALVGLREPPRERGGGLDLWILAAAAAAIFPAVSLYPPSFHSESKPRSGTGAAGAGHGWQLPVASIGPAQLAPAAHGHAAPCTDGPGARTLRARPHAPCDRARSAHCLDRLCARALGVAHAAASRRLDLLDISAAGRTALPAAVPHGRAHRLRLERQCAGQHAYHHHERRDPAAQLADDLPRRASLLPVRALPFSRRRQLSYS